MTREEAIERFENVKANALVQKASGVSEYWQNEIDGTIEAIDMAIEALSQVRCNDCKWNDDVIEVVRCKDCRYYNNDYMGKWCGRHQAPVWVKEADFCSWAKMKGGTE